MDDLSKPEVIVRPSSLPKIPIIISAVILFLALILGLNYFNLLPSLNNPNPQPKIAAKPVPSPTIASKIILSCPVPKELCSKGQVMDNGDAFYGIFFTLPVKTSILTVFSGQLSDQPKPSGRLATEPLIYLKDNQGLEAIYSFYGSTTTDLNKTISAGQEIGKIGDGTFPPVSSYTGSNFLFSVKKDGKFIKFSINDF